MTLIPTYRHRPSALHAARPAAALGFSGAFALAAILFWQNPLITAAIVLSVAVAGATARVGDELTRAARLALPFALVTTAVNVLVSQRGSTVVLRAGTVLGHRFDITLESLAWGGVTALSIVCLFLVFSLYAATVDPDELLRLVRRVSYRSALTASLATRLVPVLARDASRIRDAARCRPEPPGRFELTRAALTGSLERAVDVAAALEVRGYSAARPSGAAPRPWSRHDLRVGGAASLLVLVAVTGWATGVGAIHADSTLRLAIGPPEAALAAVLLVCGLAPFAGAGARLGVARG